LVIFLAILVLLIAVSIIIFYLNLDSQGRKNYLFIGQSIILLSIDQDNDKAVVINIPNDAYLPLSGDKGEILASGLYKMDQSQNAKGRLLMDTINNYLGVSIDGWIKLTDFPSYSNSQEFKIKLNSILGPYKINNAILFTDKNIMYPALVKLVWRINKTRNDNIETINLVDWNIYKTEDLPDGSKVLITDRIHLDQVLKDKLIDWPVFKEKLSIAIFNYSDIGGLAANLARIITNMGGNVILVDQGSSNISDNGIVYAEKAKNSYTLKRLRDHLNFKTVKNLENDSRADLIINLKK
jgi:hypothetical protein